MRDYLEVGVRLIRVVDPEGGTFSVYRSASEIPLLSGDQVLEGEEVLPGFRMEAGALLRRR